MKGPPCRAEDKQPSSLCNWVDYQLVSLDVIVALSFRGQAALCLESLHLPSTQASLNAPGHLLHEAPLGCPAVCNKDVVRL